MGEEIKKGLPRTFSLAIGAALLWMFVAICFGLYSAVRAGKFADRFLTILALVGISMPVFWIGALMNYYLGFKSGMFPNGGYVELTEDPIDWAYHLILPWTALAILFIGFYSRVLRSNVLDTINEDYVRTARAKGLSERQMHGAPRAAQLDDPDRHALGARLRRGASAAARSSPRRCSTSRAWGSTRPSRSVSSTCRRCWPSRCSAPSSSCS